MMAAPEADRPGGRAIDDAPIRPIGGPAAWRGGAFAADSDWIRTLSPESIVEIDAADRAAERRGLDWRDITRADFPLSTGAGELADLSRELEHGRGFALVRGLPVESYDEAAMRRIFWGLGTHLGTARHQNAAGELLGEVRDEVRRYGAVRERAESPDLAKSSRAKTRSNGGLRFHTDRVDVIGLCCVRQAPAGATSKIASSVTAHDEILARRPDLHALLCADYHRSRQGEERGGEGQSYALPVFARWQGHFTSQYSRTFVEAAQQIQSVPPLSAAQIEALDLLAEVAETHCLQFRLQPGDMLFLNNHVIYHARTPYRDDPEPDCDRLLFRLWLSMPNSRPLPPGHEVLWGRIEAGALRGGIAQPRTHESASE